jgi:hypothetical protein
VHKWAELLQRLLGSKSGSKKLAPADVVLDWKALWRVAQKELWPKKSISSSSRNALNLFLYVAEKSRRHFPSSEIPGMLDVFLPLITKNVRHTINFKTIDPNVPQSTAIMLPTMLSFLPHAQADLYLPLVFKLWETVCYLPLENPFIPDHCLTQTNSSAIDDRIIELLAQLAEKRVTSGPGDFSPDEWTSLKEVGIFNMKEWMIIVNKCLGSFRKSHVFSNFY